MAQTMGYQRDQRDLDSNLDFDVPTNFGQLNL